MSYLLRRLLVFPLVMFGVSVFVFIAVRLVPGDAITAMLGAKRAAAAWRARCGTSAASGTACGAGTARTTASNGPSTRPSLRLSWMV